ncbi:MAG TPA: Hsp20/alpha crystallin family protein [Syntrophorhabdaceae bacterium]|nr:Hsp20/alpha crystallin family protein [Syntrophorhabdaceae bacterium]HQM81094.1 Hsp20/alpha crystallin family protein [Syntrophorhabdaceae bacterium]
MTAKNLIPKAKSREYPASRYENLNPFYAFRQEMDRIFDNFFHGVEIEPFKKMPEAFYPNIDVVDGAKEIKVTIELPGMDEKDIDLSLDKDSLTIKGEKKEEKEEKGKNYHRMERTYGSFSRTVPFPVEIDTDKVEALFKKGVLTVTLPKTAKALKETKKILIKSQ